jgi:hypothetical protein
VPDKQLCLSNPELRAELIESVLRDIAHAKAKGWGKMHVTPDVLDLPVSMGTGINMPVGLVDRITNNFRLMKYAGVDLVFADHVTILVTCPHK